MNWVEPLHQRLWGSLFSVFPIPRQMDGPMIDRAEPCRICGCSRGKRISKVCYWDIRVCDLVACPECRLIQLDPMLTENDITRGCRAYHIQEALAESRKSRVRNCVRNFRRGVAFASRLKSRGIRPTRVLEFGPGSGYFGAGLRFVFGDISYAVADIVDEVLRDISHEHGFETLRTTPENIKPEEHDQFDLVIARDIIEHACDISTTIRNASRLLQPGGHFHFITPNGHEDAWAAHVRWKQTGEPAELLINHVNYYDPAGLRQFLMSMDLAPISYYIYTTKFTRRGRGWRMREDNAAPPSTNKSSNREIEEKAGRLGEVDIGRKDVLREWWLRPGIRWLAPAYCRLRDLRIVRNPARVNIGHEIFGLMKKVSHEGQGDE